MKALVAVVLVAACALTLGACGTGEDEPSPQPTPTSQAQFAQLMADWSGRYIECARRYGADARLTDQGSIANAYAEGRPVTNGLDADCVAEVGDPPVAAPLTPEFLRGLYLELVDQAACLRENGYAVSEPPSRDAWVEGYSGESWNPLMDVHLAGEDVVRADAACPQPDPVEAERRGLDAERGDS